MRRDIKQIVGKNVRKYRTDRGFTQEKIAEIAEIDYKYVQRIEGKSPPNLKIETVAKIAKALKIKAFELLK